MLHKLLETTLKEDKYPREIIPTITIDKNRSGIIVIFEPETIRKSYSTLKFVGKGLSADFILDVIKKRITNSERLTIKKVNLNKFRDDDG